MARPKKEGMDYFPHDTDAVNDEKIEALRLLYGNDGYAFYFILLERIYRTKDFELDVSDVETIQILSRKVGVNVERFSQILETSFKRGCFDREAFEERKVLTSTGVRKRANIVVEKRVKMRDRYKENKDGDSDAETTEETEAETPQSKVKESKEKKSKGKESKYNNKSVEEDVENPFTFYEQNGFGTIGSHIAENIIKWCEDLSDELVLKAMKIAVEHSAKNWAYVQRILKDWSDKKIQTLDQAHALIKQRQEQRNRQPGYRQGRMVRQEQLPDWYEEPQQAQVVPLPGINPNETLEEKRARLEKLQKEKFQKSGS